MFRMNVTQIYDSFSLKIIQKKILCKRHVLVGRKKGKRISFKSLFLYCGIHKTTFLNCNSCTDSI